MPRVTIIQVVYNSRRYIPQVFDAVFAQTFKDFDVFAIISGNSDNSKEYIEEHYPKVRIIDPGFNIGFARGHNLVFEQSQTEFYQLVNPDLILKPTYIENILKAFENPLVSAATGKLLFYDFNANQPTNIIDSTGTIMQRSGRSMDRGQFEEDKGQYDNKVNIFGASGAGAMFRRQALEKIKLPRISAPQSQGGYEYFDEDFHSYWEDTDVSWRLINSGWQINFVPQAVGYHGRQIKPLAQGSKNIFAYVRHHKTLPASLRRLVYVNYVSTFIKNSPKWYGAFFIRQIKAFFYMLAFEQAVLPAFVTIIKKLPKIWHKRKLAQEKRTLPIKDFEALLNSGINKRITN